MFSITDLNFDPFMRLYVANDNVARVLKLHLMTEVYLVELIAVRLNVSIDVVEFLGMSYSKKVHFAKAQDLIFADLAKTLEALNRLRNLCAHELEFDATIESLKPVVDTLVYAKDDSVRKALATVADFNDLVVYIGSYLAAVLGGAIQEHKKLLRAGK